MHQGRIEDMDRFGIDYAGGVERFGGNEALFERFIRRYRDDGRFDEIVQALALGDTGEAFRAAHTLKGVAGNLSFTRLYQAVSQLAVALRADDIANAQALMPEVEQAHNAVREALDLLFV